jgi:hypothetical protein
LPPPLFYSQRAKYFSLRLLGVIPILIKEVNLPHQIQLKSDRPDTARTILLEKIILVVFILTLKIQIFIIQSKGHSGHN